MVIQTKAKTLIEALLVLARMHGIKRMPMREIAVVMGVSESYLEQLFSHIHKQGIVKAYKGYGGGYTLARDARTIYIGDIVRLVDGKPKENWTVFDAATSVTQAWLDRQRLSDWM